MINNKYKVSKIPFKQEYCIQIVNMTPVAILARGRKVARPPFHINQKKCYIIYTENFYNCMKVITEANLNVLK